MASEIRVDKINSLSGVGTVTLSPTGVDISGITTAATLKVGTGVTASSDGDIFATGVCTATTFIGNLTGNVTGAATRVTAVNEATDTSCFPVFTTSATGDLITRTNTNLTFNSNTGALSATSFSGTLPPANVSDQNNTSTGYFDLPVGTTGERPGSPADGMIRFNSSLTQTEEYRNSAWHALSNKATVTGGTISTAGGYNIHTFTSSGTLTVEGQTKDGVDYIVVAGGGGGGGTRAGGAGAGGVVVATSQSLAVGDHTVTIGGGGAGGSGNSTGSQGGTSSLGSAQSCVGGGYGGGQGNPGGDGGSGGGSSDGAAGGAGDGTSGQGNNGGGSTGSTGGGGGGGKGTAGTTPSSYAGGNGGTALSNSYSGSAVDYGGGGGGGSRDNAARGDGGGNAGSGGKTTGTNATAGTANRGGGGGGGGRDNSGDSAHKDGAAGGSGIVIVRYLTP